MKYKGYTADVRYSEPDQLLVGRVLDINDIIVFEGESVNKVTSAFHEMVDDYLTDCAKDGRDPDKPFSGKLITRMPPDIHRQVFVTAKREEVSINSWLVEAVEEKLAKSGSL